MTRHFIPFVAGLLFAFGLALAGMTEPRKIIDFLDFTGAWDPSLLLVMAAATTVYAAVYWSSRGLRTPLAASSFSPLPRGKVDLRLVGGSALFGIGWGLVGFCPGPALVSAASGALAPVAFCAAMLFGFWITRRLDGRIKRAPTRASALG